MIIRSWLNNPVWIKKKAYKRGLAAFADALAVIALVGLSAFTISLKKAESRPVSPLFEKILSGDLKEGDSGQLTVSEMAWLAKKISQNKTCKR